MSDSYKAVKQPLKDSTTLGVKLKLLDALGEQDVISSVVLQQIKLVLPEAFKVANERNRFMHDQWVFAPQTLENGIINRMSLTDLKNWNTVPTAEVPYTYSDLEDLLRRIGALQHTFGEAVNTLQLLSVKH
ncbi:hypothetical protein FBD94_20680 [Pedobacter hiemivivus]|uniref:Uncharacterized protein n=1 Tax=Pedobacter hiemivivus TaxID=2530454 RepID=A0A4U1G293_9SPHI|nr:hypothetical protein [Pedobacter hiemivivus]TKC57691.1 hypothetical protein FBD94_20680 [Pedobacter hiemivivus]